MDKESMRREDRRTTEGEARALLERGEYGILSCVSRQGIPYGVPLNYCLLGRDICFHCAGEGKKLDNIEWNAQVSFCVVGKTEILPGEFATIYESCIAEGRVVELFDAEKLLALEGLLQKYSADFMAEGLHYINTLKGQTRVFKIVVKSVSGKARKKRKSVQ